MDTLLQVFIGILVFFLVYQFLVTPFIPHPFNQIVMAIIAIVLIFWILGFPGLAPR